MNLDIWQICCVYIAGIAMGNPIGWNLCEKWWKKRGIRMVEAINWKWINQQHRDKLTVGDKAQIDGVTYTLLSFDEKTGEGTWDDLQFKNIKDERPPSHANVRVRYINEHGGWSNTVMYEKHLDRINSKTVEWMPLFPGETK